MSNREPSTSAVAWVSAGVAVTMIAQQIASKAVRDGLFLGEFAVSALPTAVIAAAGVSFVAALLFGRFIATFSPAAAVPVLFGLSGALFFVEAALSQQFPRAVAAGLFMHTAAFGAAVVSGFWSVINERFDPYTARQVMGRIAAGAALGGLVGGVLTWIFAELPPAILLSALGVSNWVCGAAIIGISQCAVKRERQRNPAGLFDGFKVLKGNRYPRTIALLVLLGALMTAIVDYVFKAGVSSADGQSLVGIFAIFYTGTGILTFLLQSTASNRLLKRFGVIVALLFFPMVAILGLTAAIVIPSVITLIALRGGAMVIENSLYRSGYELLYTPVPPEQKRSAKVLIDLGCDRIGTAAGSGVALLVLALASAAADQLLLGLALVVAVMLVFVVVYLRREYVASLAARIRSRRPTAQVAGNATQALALTFVDAGEQLPWQDEAASASDGVAETVPLQRGELLALVQARADEKRAATSDAAPPSSTPRAVVSPRLLATPLLALLRDAEQPSAEWSELLRSAPATIGQLSDILLSERQPQDVRLKAAALLSTLPTARVVSVFVEALEAAEFRIRRAAAISLLAIVETRPSLAPPTKLLSARAAHELRFVARASGDDTPLEQASVFRTDEHGHRFAPSFELALTLLAIAGGADALKLAISAVTSDDPVQRGTGLEYLDNLLPADVRELVVGLAKNPERTQARQRVAGQGIDALAAELRAGTITLAELRQRHRAQVKDRYEQRSAQR